MCGIVGYTGKELAKSILLDGLRRLEYRGYDSAGLTLCGEDGLHTVKALGKVMNLETACAKESALTGTTGIAHTRWATHGAPAVRNAHPHQDEKGRFAVVHNGIIDNFADLRRRLEADGHEFVSDTDSEVIPHLLEEFYTGDLLTAVVQVLRLLHGTYGIAVVCAEHPEMIVTARLGSPIVIGKGNDCNLVASDVTPLASFTRDVIYLNDGEVAAITPTSIKLQNIDNVEIEPSVKQIDWNVEACGKGNYEHFMLKEIYEQPEVIASTMRGRIDLAMGSAKLSGLNMTPRELAQISRIVIAACGTSRHAGMVGEYFFEDISGIPTEVEQAAEFRYRNPIIEPNTLVIPISQSGETADTLAAVREALNKGATVAALCNVVGSTIAREAGRGVYLHAGPEICVASTKAFTCQVTALLLMALMLGRNRRLNQNDGLQLAKELTRLPEMILQVLEQAPVIERIARKYAKADDFFYIGRGSLYPVALEGALKLKEISYIHAEGYQAAELKHGPISLLDERVPIVAMANAVPGQDKMLGNIQECLARKAPVIAVVTGNDTSANRFTQDIIRVPESTRFVSPLTTAVALQLLAYYVARERGCEIDQPRNLAKSVTVE